MWELTRQRNGGGEEGRLKGKRKEDNKEEKKEKM